MEKDLPWRKHSKESWSGYINYYYIARQSIQSKGLQGSIYQEDIAIQKVYAPKNRASKYMEQRLSEMKGEINKFTIIVRDYSTFLSESNSTGRQKIRKAIEEVNNTINQLNLTDIYKTLYPTIEYTFFFQVHMEHSPR